MNIYQEVTTRIRREMNGAVSGSMRFLSPVNQRKINFGVSLPTIKDICLEYVKDHDTAVKLREHSVREWWLAAAFIDNPKTMTISDAEVIADKWISTEESDVYAMYLLSKTCFAFELALKWLKSSNELKVNAGEKIIMNISADISDEDAKRILELTSSEIPIRTIYQKHPSLRSYIRSNGPYSFSWILDEIDRY